jgi:hypothetical protein
MEIETDLEDAAVQALDEALSTVVDEAAAPIRPKLDNRTVIAQTRDWVATMKDHLSKREEAIATRIAIAAKELDEAVVRAKADHDAVVREADIELYQITTTREALSLAHARLQKAEVK